MKIRTWTVCVCAVFLAACSETVVERYGTLEEARKAGEIERGWLPTFLPESSTDLVISYDLDTNETWGSFRFSTADAAQLRNALTSIDLTGRSLRKPSALRDWPGFLKGSLSGDSLTRAGYESYKAGTDHPFFVVVRWQEGKAYFWRYCCPE